MGGHSVLRSNSKLHDNFGKMPSLLPPLLPLSLSLSLSLSRMEHNNKDAPGEDEEVPDPVICFLLNPSEQINACLQIAGSPILPGADSQESYKLVMEWIHSTVKSLPQYDDERNQVMPAYAVNRWLL